MATWVHDHAETWHTQRMAAAAAVLVVAVLAAAVIAAAVSAMSRATAPDSTRAPAAPTTTMLPQPRPQVAPVPPQ